MSRRELFTLWRRPSERVAPTLLRPPGAIDEARFADSCQRCGRCVEVCPREAIHLAGPGGTPAIVARESPCVVCDGLLCTSACPSGALSPLPVAEVRMGTARVDPQRCVAFAGQPCDSCLTGCPIVGALREVGGAPVVDPARCIGCGLCESRCPLPGAAAIRVVPRAALR